MNIYIETYRGIDIIFMTETERFSYQIDIGSRTEKQSYSACKKSIDDYVKNNQKFTPFLVRHFSSGKTLNIVGIRKDERFVYTDYKGEKQQMSSWEEDSYIIYDESDEKHYARIAILESQKDAIDDEIKNERKKIIRESLKQLKKQYIV